MAVHLEEKRLKPGFFSTTAGRDLMIAVSLANLCFVRVWSELLTYTRADMYLMKSPPGPAALSAAVVNVLLTAGLFWGLVTLVRRSRSGLAKSAAEIAFLFSLAIPMNGIRAVMTHFFPYLRSPLFELLGFKGTVALVVIIGVIYVAGVLLFHRRLAAVAGTVMTAFLPFCAVTFGQAVWKGAHVDTAEFADRPKAAVLPVADGAPRVLWVLCDEWDYRLTFVDPDPSLRLPEIAGLRREMLFLDHALPPGPETPISIPAYFTGKHVDSVVYDGPRELQVTFHGAAKPEPWSGQATIFSRAHELGVNTALVEWFHPTCRVLSGLTSCESWEMPIQFNSMGRSFAEMVPGQARSLFETTLFSVFGQSLSLRQQVKTYQTILKDGIRIANQPRNGLSWIHLPIPHAPHVYSRRTGGFTLRNSPITGYFDSLALLDKTLGEIRRSMQSSGMWDKTTVLITSDHPYRSAEVIDGKTDPRIPYLLKMAGQKEGAVYSRPYDAIATQDLLLAVLRGEVSTIQDATKWMEKNPPRQ